MIRKLLPFVFLVTGLAAGVGTGIVLGPTAKDGTGPTEEATKEEPKETKTKSSKDSKKGKKAEGSEFEYLKLTKQFVVPVVADSEIAALVTMSLSLEMRPGLAEAVYEIEPKLRDGFLQVLFDHANSGGFDGAFTQSDNLSTLRNSLLEVARKDLGDDVSRILIMSVARQDT